MITKDTSNFERKRKDKSYIILLVMISLVIFAVVVASIQLRTDEISQYLKKSNQFTGLMILSNPENRVTFEVVVINVAKKRAALMNIPGNLGIFNETLNKMDAIETLYKEQELSLLISKISNLIDSELIFYLDLTEEKISNLVDLLGGVEVFIPNPVNLSDLNGYVLLPSGTVLLDGDKILSYINYSQPHESWLESSERLHRLHQGLFKRFSEYYSLLEVGTVKSYLFNLVGTNLSKDGLTMLVSIFSSIDVERMIFQNALGKPQKVNGRGLLFPFFDGELIRETISQIKQTLASGDTYSNEDILPALEILNGTKVSGLARRATALFQSYGYDVLRIDNAERDDYQKTAIVERRGKLDSAIRIAELINCHAAYTETDFGGDPDVDITIMLGGDFDGRRCKN